MGDFNLLGITAPGLNNLPGGLLCVFVIWEWQINNLSEKKWNFCWFASVSLMRFDQSWLFCRGIWRTWSWLLVSLHSFGRN